MITLAFIISGIAIVIWLLVLILKIPKTMNIIKKFFKVIIWILGILFIAFPLIMILVGIIDDLLNN